jgi:chromosome segregation ATPase
MADQISWGIEGNQNLSEEITKIAVALRELGDQSESTLSAVVARLQAAGLSTENLLSGTTELRSRYTEAARTYSTVSTQIEKLNRELKEQETLLSSLRKRDTAGKASATAEIIEITERLEQLNTRLKNTKTFFSTLGVSITETSGELKSAEKVIGEWLIQFGNAPDSATRAAQAIRVFRQSLSDLNKEGSATRKDIGDLGKTLHELEPIFRDLTGIGSRQFAGMASQAHTNTDAMKRFSGMLDDVATRYQRILRVQQQIREMSAALGVVNTPQFIAASECRPSAAGDLPARADGRLASLPEKG